MERFYKELDIVNILKNVRLSKVIIATHFNRRQRLLLGMQRSNMIESSEEQSDDSCNAIEIVEKLNSEKPMVRIN